MPPLDPHTRHRLLRIARRAIETVVLNGGKGDPAVVPADQPPDDADLATLPRSGVFVTLHKGERLRGCIGTFDASDDLLPTLRRIAVAATQDPRFRATPIGARELAEISIEISLLSPMRRLANPMDLVLGRDGIYIRRGSRSGCFLPDVATEQGWDKAEFLSQCCAHKAGLPPDAWRSAETEVSVFSVEKFGDASEI